MNELEKELSRLLKDCEIDSEYVHQDFLHIVANHFANWQEHRKYVFVSNEIQQAFDGWVQSRKGKAIYARDAFVAGMNFKEQQMMKDAVICVVEPRYKKQIGWYLSLDSVMNEQNHKVGDKVKLAIIKKD